MVVAPATANIIGKMAGGIADDLLSTTLMACDKPKIICPAMNTNMLNNPAVVRNLETLRRMAFLSCRVERATWPAASTGLDAS